MYTLKPTMLVTLAVTAALTGTSTLISADGKLQHLPVLTLENGRYTVFDHMLNEHGFTQMSNGQLSADPLTNGTLIHLQDHHYRWIDNRGHQHRFEGSQYMGLEPDSPLAECLPSDNPVGNSSTNPTIGDQMDDDGSLQTHEQNAQCDTQSQGSHTFTAAAQHAADTRLDARPESCQSYFVQYHGTQRGSEIETGLYLHAPYQNMNPTLRTFPVIDFIGDDALYVVHSRDLGNRTFNSASRPNALLNQLLKDGEDIQTRFVDVLVREGSISASELGKTTTINADQLKPITLQLVIRDGIASISQWQQISQARRELQLRFDITLEVVAIP